MRDLAYVNMLLDEIIDRYDLPEFMSSTKDVLAKILHVLHSLLAQKGEVD